MLKKTPDKSGNYKKPNTINQATTKKLIMYLHHIHLPKIRQWSVESLLVTED